MKFLATKFPDAWLLAQQRQLDERGFFARTWCKEEFDAKGLSSDLVQCSVSFNKVRGTLRGMHFQAAPHQEVKLVRCTRGCIFDVIVDLRAGSINYGVWQGFELSADNGDSLYIPEGFAHGFQTLDSNTEVYYQMSGFYNPESSRAFHHADQTVGIDWPLPVAAISKQDELSSTLGITRSIPLFNQ